MTSNGVAGDGKTCSRINGVHVNTAPLASVFSSCRRDAAFDKTAAAAETSIKKRRKFTSFEPYLRDFFYWYGGFTHAHRWLLFTIPILLTPLFATGFMWFNELRVDDPGYVFTPRDARWKHELSTFTRLWPLEENKFQPGKSFETQRFINVLCKAADGGNVLRPHILNEIQLLNNFIMHNITVPTQDGRFNLSYQDLCLSYDWVCGGNEHIAMFREMEQVGRVIDLTFPKGGNKDTPVYLGAVLGDIILNRSDNHVAEARITQLFYFLKQEPESVRDYSTDFEYAVERFILHVFESKLITLSFAHYQSLQDGLDENAQRFVPNFVISFTALTIYCIICAFVLKRHSSSSCSIDWIRSKPYVACAGLANTIIALISSFGLLLLIGVQYNVINTIIPFLIIAIGIDDMFIMTACYDQVDRALPTRLRMAEMMRSSGVAVSITNVTDILSFLIGCLTDLPGVELFCVYAFVSVLFCYVYQLTFFAAFMAIMSEIEKQERHCLFFYKIKPKTTLMTTKEVDGKKLRGTPRKCDIYPIYDAEKLPLPPSLSGNAVADVRLTSTDCFHHGGYNFGDIYITPPPPQWSRGKAELRGSSGAIGSVQSSVEGCDRASQSVIAASATQVGEDGESERIYEQFYNENIEFSGETPPLKSYEYCAVSTLDRRRHPTAYDSALEQHQKQQQQQKHGAENYDGTAMSTLDRLRKNRKHYYNGLTPADNNDLAPAGVPPVDAARKVSSQRFLRKSKTQSILIDESVSEETRSSGSSENDSARVPQEKVRATGNGKQMKSVVRSKCDNHKLHSVTKKSEDSRSTSSTSTDETVDALFESKLEPKHNYVPGGELPTKVCIGDSPRMLTKTHDLSASTSKRPLHTISENRTHLFFGRYYAPFLLRNGVRALVVVAYAAYLVVAIIGCSQFREGLEPQHLVTSDHYIAKYFTDIKMFWKMGAQLHVAVLKPPNLTDAVERTKLLNLVTAFENTDYTMGREGTVFFLLEYLNYLSQLNAEPENTNRIWHKKLRSWLKYTGGAEQWERDIVYDEDGVEFHAFRFQVAMKNIVEPNQHKLAAKLLREIADAQPFHVEIYHEAFPFADQYLIILPSTYRNVLISLCVMTVIAFMLIPSIPSSVLIVLSIISISTGVFGYMTFWGVNLDAISMISIIMSIGFAVDLSAHIVYAFVTAHGGETASERVAGALEHLGWPIFQGATSTIAGITVLYTVDAYIILTFFKTIWLTMVLGLIHGLVFIPVMLSFIPISFFRISSAH